VLLEDSAQSTSQKNWIPSSCPDDVIYRPNTQLSKASSIWTMRTFRPDLPLCQEASNCSSLHPSGRLCCTSRRHSVFDQLYDFLPKHRYGKIADTVRTHSSIRQVSHSKFRRPNDSLHGADVRATYMELRASNQLSGRPFPWSGRVKP
jgi:hypothetical protein